jgi:hypothetical protein
MWSNNNSRRYLSKFLPEYRVYPTIESTPIQAGSAYCRLYLVEMYLGKTLFDRRYPVVHARIEFEQGGKKTVIPYLAKPEYIQDVAQNNLDRVIQCNYAMTDLFPFNGGLVTLDARLLSMEASDVIKKFIKIMGRFSELLVVPELSSMIKLAQPLYDGIEELTGSGHANLELGYRQSFEEAGHGGANFLRSGYFVAILAEESQINPEQLCVVNDSLRVGSPGQGTAFVKDSKPLQGYSYMLFCLKQYSEQNWEKLSKINDLVNQAIDTTFKQDYEYVKRFLLPIIQQEIWTSQDIAKNDRTKMILRIKDELKQIGLESTTPRKRSLHSIMQKPLPEIDQETEAELQVLTQMFGE